MERQVQVADCAKIVNIITPIILLLDDLVLWQSSNAWQKHPTEVAFTYTSNYYWFRTSPCPPATPVTMVCKDPITFTEMGFNGVKESIIVIMCVILRLHCCLVKLYRKVFRLQVFSDSLHVYFFAFETRWLADSLNFLRAPASKRSKFCIVPTIYNKNQRPFWQWRSLNSIQLLASNRYRK